MAQSGSRTRRLVSGSLLLVILVFAATAWAAEGGDPSADEGPGYTLLVFYVTLALLVSFLCSVFEAVLLSVTPAYIGSLELEGKPAGARLRRLKEDIESPLTAILSLNTIAHTVGAAGAGAEAAKIFGNQWLGLASAILTLLILFVSEIIPKTLGHAYWRPLAPLVASVLAPLIIGLYPFVFMARLVTRTISGEGHGIHVSRDEIQAMADLGEEGGVIKASESAFLKGVLQFSSLMAADVMTPRTVVVSLPAETLVKDVINRDDCLRFSRIPLHEEFRDKITTYVLTRDVLLCAARDEFETHLRDLAREIPMVPESLALPVVFDRLLASKSHVALAVDEYGGTAGLVTMEDVVETLLDLEIVDEIDTVEDMQEFARAQWRRRASKLGLIQEEDFRNEFEEEPGEGEKGTE